MSRQFRPLRALVLAVSIGLGASQALAQESSAPAGDAQAVKLDRAKRLFHQGNALRRARDCRGALKFYLQSMALVKSAANLINAAYCTAELGRYDEALELYEELLARDDVTDEERSVATQAVSEFGRKTGSVLVSANTDGAIVIDGRMRGTLPLADALPALPGRRTVRVIKDGFAAFERVIEVRVGTVTRVDARLEPLGSAGRLRVASADLVGAELYVDGARVGELPWEGTLAPGAHVVVVRKGDHGTAPLLATLVQGQTISLPVSAKPLGADFRIQVEPPTAELAIDGVVVGRGSWQGALPIGTHRVEARDSGYRPLRIALARDVPPVVELSLRADPEHPRWAAGPRSQLWIEGFAGIAIASSLGSDAEAYCDRGACSTDRDALGIAAGARAGYEFPVPVSIEIGAGYLRVEKALDRTVRDSYVFEGTAVATEYRLNDEIALSGPFVAGGASYRAALGAGFEASGAIEIGVLFASTRDAISGTGSAGGRTLPLAIDGSGRTTRSAAMFLMPELRFGVRLGALRAGTGFAALFFPADGPRNATGDLSPIGTDCTAHGPTIDCAQGSDAIAAERGRGSFVAWMPSVRLGYALR